MASVGEKADYVRSASLIPDKSGHHCHWPNCDRKVPPAMWGCKMHWFKLPAHLRARIWATYRPGQEVSKAPSSAYLAVAREVQDWIAAQVGRHPQGRDAEGGSGAEGTSTRSGAASDRCAQTPPGDPHA